METIDKCYVQNCSSLRSAVQDWVNSVGYESKCFYQLSESLIVKSMVDYDRNMHQKFQPSDYYKSFHNEFQFYKIGSIELCTNFLRISLIKWLPIIRIRKIFVIVSIAVLNRFHEIVSLSKKKMFVIFRQFQNLPNSVHGIQWFLIVSMSSVCATSPIPNFYNDGKSLFAGINSFPIENWSLTREFSGVWIL